MQANPAVMGVEGRLAWARGYLLRVLSPQLWGLRKERLLRH